MHVATLLWQQREKYYLELKLLLEGSMSYNLWAYLTLRRTTHVPPPENTYAH
jgi:hypothetical protein